MHHFDTRMTSEYRQSLESENTTQSPEQMLEIYVCKHVDTSKL